MDYNIIDSENFDSSKINFTKTQVGNSNSIQIIYDGTPFFIKLPNSVIIKDKYIDIPQSESSFINILNFIANNIVSNISTRKNIKVHPIYASKCDNMGKIDTASPLRIFYTNMNKSNSLLEIRVINNYTSLCFDKFLY